MNPAIYNKAATEFFTWNGEVMVIHHQTIHTFDEAPIPALELLSDSLDNDKRAQDGLTLMGIDKPIERLRKYAACRFGSLGDSADFGGGTKNDSMINCPLKYTCKGYGLTCKRKFSLEGEMLSAREVEIGSALASGQSPEQIAETLFVEQITIRSTLLHIKQKLNTQNYNGIVSFFTRNMMNTL